MVSLAIWQAIGGTSLMAWQAVGSTSLMAWQAIGGTSLMASYEPAPAKLETAMELTSLIETSIAVGAPVYDAGAIPIPSLAMQTCMQHACESIQRADMRHACSIRALERTCKHACHLNADYMPLTCHLHATCMPHTCVPQAILGAKYRTCTIHAARIPHPSSAHAPYMPVACRTHDGTPSLAVQP